MAGIYKGTKEQLEAIKKVTGEALKTKEAARQFLIDAGILKEQKSAPPHSLPHN